MLPLDGDAEWKHVLRALVVPAGLVVFYFVAPFAERHWQLGVLYGLLASAAVIPVTVRRAHRISTSHRPVADAIEAVVMVASLMVFGFATSYYALAIHTDQFPDIHTRIDALYFTITTSATVGFGDIAPDGQGARALVAAHIVINLGLIGTTLRVLTHVAGQRRTERLSDDPR